MVLRLTFALALLTIAPASIAEPAPEVRQLADAYLEAYQKMELDRLESLYAENAIFIDPTSLTLKQTFDWQGRDQILAELRSVEQQTEAFSIRYELSKTFGFGQQVVYIGQGFTFYQVAGNVTKASAPVVTIVTVENGRIVEHRDYVDYEALHASMETTPAKSGE